MLEFPHLRKEWLASLQELHKKWDGKLDDGIEEPAKDVWDCRIFATYASLLTNFRERKIFLSRVLSDDAEVEIYVYGKWKSELLLSHEDAVDKVLKAIGLEDEITLKGGDANVVIFNGKYLIKGEPEEFITAFLSNDNVQDIVNDLGNFLMLHIRDNLTKITYEIESAKSFAPDRLTELINRLIDFLQALEQKESGK